MPGALLTGDYNVLFLANSCLSLHSAFSSLSHWCSVTSSSQTKFHVRRIFLVSLAWSCHGWKYRIFHRDDTENRARGLCLWKIPRHLHHSSWPVSTFSFLLPICWGLHFGSHLEDQASSFLLLTNLLESKCRIQQEITPRDRIMISFFCWAVVCYPWDILLPTCGNSWKFLTSMWPSKQGV